MTATAVLLALSEHESTPNITLHPTVVEIERASSIHVLAFTSHGDLLLAESEGDFSMSQWDSVYDRAKAACCGSIAADGIDIMRDGGEDEDEGGMMQFIKSTLQKKVETDMHWRS